MIALLTLTLLLTEYEQAVASLPPSAFGGGCPGEGLPKPEQKEERARYYSAFGWPILTSDAVDRVAGFIGSRGAIDYGAGVGYFSYLLAKRGVDVIAVDDFSWGTPPKLWHPVQDGGFDALRGTEKRALVLSWPTRGTGMATRALKKWGGDRLVYAGEILRGAGEPSFFRELAENWTLVERVDVPRWHNLSDALWLFRRTDRNGPGWEWMVNTMRDCLP